MNRTKEYFMNMRCVLIVLFSLQFLNQSFSQVPGSSQDSILQISDEKHEGVIKIYLGNWYPFGQLKEDFNSSFSIGASLGFNLKNDIRLEAKGQAIINPEKSELTYKLRDSLYQTSAVTLVNAGFRFIKEKRIKPSLILDLGAELNLNFISLDMFDSESIDENSVISAGLAAGFGIKKILKHGFSIGIESYMHITPYSISSNLVSVTGMLSNITQVFFSLPLPGGN